MLIYHCSHKNLSQNTNYYHPVSRNQCPHAGMELVAMSKLSVANLKYYQAGSKFYEPVSKFSLKSKVGLQWCIIRSYAVAVIITS